MLDFPLYYQLTRLYADYAVVRRHEAGGAEQVGLAQAALRHLGRVVGETGVGPDEVEGVVAHRLDVARRQRVDLLLDDDAGEQRHQHLSLIHI